MPEREQKQKPAPEGAREEVVEDAPATSEARREAEGRHRRSPGRNRLRARGQRRGVRTKLRAERAASDRFVQVDVAVTPVSYDSTREALQGLRRVEAARRLLSSRRACATATDPSARRAISRAQAREYADEPAAVHRRACKRWQQENPERLNAYQREYSTAAGSEARGPQEPPASASTASRSRTTSACSRRRAACARSAGSRGPRSARCTSITITRPARSAGSSASGATTRSGDFATSRALSGG